MDLLTPAIIGIGLSMDFFAVSLAVGTTTKPVFSKQLPSSHAPLVCSRQV